MNTYTSAGDDHATQWYRATRGHNLLCETTSQFENVVVASYENQFLVNYAQGRHLGLGNRRITRLAQPLFLLRPQGIHRICPCGFECLIGHGCEYEQESENTAYEKIHKVQIDAIGEVLQPSARKQIGYWTGDHTGDNYELDKFFG